MFSHTYVSIYLTFKIFYCINFVHEHNNLGKIKSVAIKYIFVGYFLIHKRYKFFDKEFYYGCHIL